MFFVEELLLIFGLSMDGFAASVCLGIQFGRRGIVPIVLLISGFHVGMLLIGFALGAGARGLMSSVFPWLAGLMLTLLGANMLRTAGREESGSGGSAVLAAAGSAFATSLDAMTVGAAFALMEASARQAGGLTALVMGTLSLLGAALGGRIGEKYRRGARTAGGAILTVLGLRMLIAALL